MALFWDQLAALEIHRPKKGEQGMVVMMIIRRTRTRMVVMMRRRRTKRKTVTCDTFRLHLHRGHVDLFSSVFGLWTGLSS